MLEEFAIWQNVQNVDIWIMVLLVPDVETVDHPWNRLLSLQVVIIVYPFSSILQILLLILNNPL